MTFVEKKIRAVFNRLDAEPGATQRHSKNPPVSPLRKGGKKDQTPPTFPPCEGSEFRVLAFRGGDEVGIISSYLTSF